MKRQILKIVVASSVGALILAGTAGAQPTKTERSAASLECSRQADEKGLHGKARKKFRSKCLKQTKRQG
jgi:hypothetical protein